jgi:hypothetical protein
LSNAFRNGGRDGLFDKDVHALLERIAGYLSVEAGEDGDDRGAGTLGSRRLAIVGVATQGAPRLTRRTATSSTSATPT